MLLSWLDRLTLFIHPQRLILEQRRWRGKTSRQALTVAPPESGDADWQPALAAAQVLLQAHGRRGAALRIVVADAFVRYALMPWSENVMAYPARLAMARALLKNALGDKADSLEIALDKPLFGKNGLAAGIDRQLLAGLRAAAKAQGVRLSNLQPRLIVELAAQRKQLGDGWFACPDQGWLALVGLRDGEIVCLRNHRAATGGAAELSGELAGLLVAESTAVDTRKVFISSRDAIEPKLGGNWETMHLAAVFGGDAHA